MRFFLILGAMLATTVFSTDVSAAKQKTNVKVTEFTFLSVVAAEATKQPASPAFRKAVRAGLKHKEDQVAFQDFLDGKAPLVKDFRVRTEFNQITVESQGTILGVASFSESKKSFRWNGREIEVDLEKPLLKQIENALKDRAEKTAHFSLITSAFADEAPQRQDLDRVLATLVTLREQFRFSRDLGDRTILRNIPDLAELASNPWWGNRTLNCSVDGENRFDYTWAGIPVTISSTTDSSGRERLIVRERLGRNDGKELARTDVTVSPEFQSIPAPNRLEQYRRSWIQSNANTYIRCVAERSLRESGSEQRINEVINRILNMTTGIDRYLYTSNEGARFGLERARSGPLLDALDRYSQAYNSYHRRGRGVESRYTYDDLASAETTLKNLLRSLPPSELALAHDSLDSMQRSRTSGSNYIETQKNCGSFHQAIGDLPFRNESNLSEAMAANFATLSRSEMTTYLRRPEWTRRQAAMASYRRTLSRRIPDFADASRELPTFSELQSMYPNRFSGEEIASLRNGWNDIQNANELLASYGPEPTPNNLQTRESQRLERLGISMRFLRACCGDAACKSAFLENSRVNINPTDPPAAATSGQ